MTSFCSFIHGESRVNTFLGWRFIFQEKGKANIYWGRNGEHFLIELNLFISCLHSGMAQMDIHSLLLAHRQENETLLGLYLNKYLWSTLWCHTFPNYSCIMVKQMWCMSSWRLCSWIGDRHANMYIVEVVHAMQKIRMLSESTMKQI